VKKLGFASVTYFSDRENRSVTVDLQVYGDLSEGTFLLQLPGHLHELADRKGVLVTVPVRNGSAVGLRGSDLKVLRERAAELFAEHDRLQKTHSPVILFEYKNFSPFFVTHEGEICPNGVRRRGRWSEASRCPLWGQQNCHGMLCHINLSVKEEWKGPDGEVVHVTYRKVSAIDVESGDTPFSPDDENALFLASVLSSYLRTKTESVIEIPYTEDAARFFVEFFRKLWTLNHQLNQMFSSEDALKLALSSQSAALEA